MTTSARVFLVMFSLSFAVACGGENKNPSPGPSSTSAPTASNGGPSSPTGDPKTTSSTPSNGDGGTGDAGYFAGGSRLPQ